MLRSHRVADIRAAEQALMAGLAADGLPTGELMQRAARGLAAALDDVLAGDVLLVLVGPGDNGGDALHAATHLLERGVRVDLCLLDEAKAHPEGLAAARAAGAQVVAAPGGHRWCLDAVLGIGGRPGLPGPALDWQRWMAEQRPTVVAVDLPSGTDVDGATVSADGVRADRTVTFGTYKNALLAGPASSMAGETVSLVDIGLGPYLPEPDLEALEVGDGPALAAAVGWLADADTHKYTRGVVGVVAGSEQYAGAAHLCIAGAQAGTAGMIRFAGSAALSARVVDRAPEVVAAKGRVQAWVLGPGGDGDTRELVDAALAEGVPAVLDASALTDLPTSFDVPVLLTPHAGELARMLDLTREAVEADPLGSVRAAAERWDASVLLKGRRTLVATPGRPTRVNLTGTPWLATAGAGDVLAGFAGSLLASGLDPHEAGSWAAFLHGLAAEAANPGGPITASDVAATLPLVVASVLGGGSR